MYSLLNQENGLIPQLMTKMNIENQSISNSVLSVISQMPKVSEAEGKAAQFIYPMKLTGLW